MTESRYVTRESRERLAKTIAEESFVLLKNQGKCLPLSKGTVAFFGRACKKPILGGMGSGMSFRGKEIPSIVKACKEAGLSPVPLLDEFYEAVKMAEKVYDPMAELAKAGAELVASGEIYDIFGQYHAQPEEPEVSEELVRQAAKQTDTAVWVLGRGAGGEECDRRLENDYYLQESERRLLEKINRFFSRVVILINSNGMIDASWIDSYENIRAALYIGAAGEGGPAAAAAILTGKTSPSGKLSFTIAKAYEDYPAASHFSFDKDRPDTILEYKSYGLDAAENGSRGFKKSPVTVYQEGIYLGYRYFDSFGKEVLYPFGFGLSYAEFSITDYKIKKEKAALQISAVVRNISEKASGKEVMQVYISAPSVRLEQPWQRFAGCVKTALLLPGEAERVTLTIPLRELSSYEEESAAWILEEGCYWVRIGNSSRNTHIAGALLVEQRIVCEQAENILPLRQENREKLCFLSAEGEASVTCGEEQAEKEQVEVLQLREQDFLGERGREGREEASVTVPDGLSLEQLAAMAVGYGPGLPFGGLLSGEPCTICNGEGKDITVMTHPSKAYGYVSPALPEYGIPSVRYKDGPAGVGMTAWPTAMLLACCCNGELLTAFGEACGYEARLQGVDSWLAPGLNLLRHPLGGRNFEYFSEDPYLTGWCGSLICQGAAHNPGLTACPKHLALNGQETYRRGSARQRIDAVDSIVQERAARELYLKPFEMVIKSSPVRTIMTAFNKINGVFAAGSYDLCTKLLRGEWGYRGVVITDWGDMDIVADGADAVAAGNDVIMPGGPPVIRQILAGCEEGRVTGEQLLKAVSHLLYFVERSGSFQEQKKETRE